MGDSAVRVKVHANGKVHVARCEVCGELFRDGGSEHHAFKNAIAHVQETAHKVIIRSTVFTTVSGSVEGTVSQ